MFPLKRLAIRVRELPYQETSEPQGAFVSEIKVRNAAHSEFSFSTAEEFGDVIQNGGITADWEVYHATARRWLPITNHPVFTARIRQHR